MPGSLSLDELHLIAETLAEGFQALLEQVQQQKEIEGKLRHRLERAIEQYEQRDHSWNSSSAEISDWQNEIVKQINTQTPQDDTTPQICNERIDRAEAALQRFRSEKMPALVQVRKCPITHKTTDQEDFEHDFTTPGRIGDLGCPFAAMANGANPPCGPDPIAEEFHGEKASARSKSSGPGGSRCPIRFLDKHSPEEVAQYFENHKHEIPRSHQICVNRYQRNENSIRELDAKYGNLVSMIQGLGNKHKPFLPENEKVADEPDHDSTQAIEQAVEEWAVNVDVDSATVEEPERVQRFERPLRDIRVGESPSRPWGISVPVGKSPAASAVPSDNGIPSSKRPTSATPAHAPVPTPIAAPVAVPDVATADVPGDLRSETMKQEHRQPSGQPNTPPQIVFNGPVFFGYSAEQAALFLQNLISNGVGQPM